MALLRHHDTPSTFSSSENLGKEALHLELVLFIHIICLSSDTLQFRAIALNFQYVCMSKSRSCIAVKRHKI